MLKAEQLALIQEANQQLLAIRQLELDYYTTVFSNFGTVAALIAGFTMSALTSLNAVEFECAEFWRGLYWTSTAVCLGTSLHCVLSTTFVNVYGSGLALRGPTGSMVRAVEGMVEEKDNIFNSFIVSAASFLVMGVAIGWIIMEKYAAAIFTAISLVASYFWYRYCIRIYRRFKIHNVTTNWNERTMSTDAPTHEDIKGSAQDVEVITVNPVLNASKEKKGFLSSFGKNSMSSVADDKDEKDRMSVMSGGTLTYVPSTGIGSSNQNPNRIIMEGYLTKKGTPTIVGGDPWARRYFVIKGKNLFYYNSREDFEKDPSNPIKNRPVVIAEYRPAMVNGRDSPYVLELVPKDSSEGGRQWQFKCDTIAGLIA